MIEMEKTDTKEELPYSKIIVTLVNILDERIRGEIATGKRQISGNTYEETPIPSSDLSETAQEYELDIEEQINYELSEKGFLTLTMFSCPNGNATDMYNNFQGIIPQEFNQEQVFMQRIPLIKKILKQAENVGEKIVLNILIGDSDFLTYYYPQIERNIEDPNISEYFSNTSSYRDSLAKALRAELVGGRIDADVYTYKDKDITTMSLEQITPSKSLINVISLTLNTTNWGTERIEETDEKDIEEESYYTSRRCNSTRFDPSVFANQNVEIYREMSKIKINEYKKQGELVQEIGGRIVLMDELPPALKSRFFNTNSNLLFLFPWIRDNDIWKTKNETTLRKIGFVKEKLARLWY